MTAIETRPTIVSSGQYDVHTMVLDEEKIKALWAKLQEFRTIFSDLTRDDFWNFLGALTNKYTLWYEVWNGEEIVGLIWLTDIEQIIDMNVHILFFDRKLKDKYGVCREFGKWLFKRFPVQRITAPLPAIYFATIVMLKDLGFVHEGTKRSAVLLGGKWVDMFIFGITRPETEAQWLD